MEEKTIRGIGILPFKLAAESVAEYTSFVAIYLLNLQCTF